MKPDSGGHRIKSFSLVIVCALLALVPQAANAEMYTWTNADGSLGVTDDPAKVPEHYRGRTKKTGDGAGEGGTGGVYYSRPQQSVGQKREEERKPIITMEEQKKLADAAAEKRKKDEEEIKKTWNGMKKALAGQ